MTNYDSTISDNINYQFSQIRESKVLGQSLQHKNGNSVFWSMPIFRLVISPITFLTEGIIKTWIIPNRSVGSFSAWGLGKS